jgi:hypothetical protein
MHLVKFCMFVSVFIHTPHASQTDISALFKLFLVWTDKTTTMQEEPHHRVM